MKENKSVICVQIGCTFFTICGLLTVKETPIRYFQTVRWSFIAIVFNHFPYLGQIGRRIDREICELCGRLSEQIFIVVMFCVISHGDLVNCNRNRFKTGQSENVQQQNVKLNEFHLSSFP